MALSLRRPELSRHAAPAVAQAEDEKEGPEKDLDTEATEVTEEGCTLGRIGVRVEFGINGVRHLCSSCKFDSDPNSTARLAARDQRVRPARPRPSGATDSPSPTECGGDACSRSSSH